MIAMVDAILDAILDAMVDAMAEDLRQPSARKENSQKEVQSISRTTRRPNNAPVS